MTRSPAFLAKRGWIPPKLRRLVKPLVREFEGNEQDNVLIIEDTIEEKPYTDERELICRPTITARVETSKASTSSAPFTRRKMLPSLPSRWPSSWSRKPSGSSTKNGASGREREPPKKNELYRRILFARVQNQLKFRYVLSDMWYAASENMSYIKGGL
jgi:hypothetical protein